MREVWIKRILRVVSNFGISFITPFTGSGVAQSLYSSEVDVGQMLFVGLFSSSAYTALIALQEIRDYASDGTGEEEQ